jgi:hypothetical protein
VGGGLSRDALLIFEKALHLEITLPIHFTQIQVKELSIFSLFQPLMKLLCCNIEGIAFVVLFDGYINGIYRNN